jgi:hypothetical protein
MPAIRRLACTLRKVYFFTIFALFTAQISVSLSVASTEMELADMAQRLFPVQGQPLASEDTWRTLSRRMREAWSFTNDRLRQPESLTSASGQQGLFPRAWAALDSNTRPPIRIPVRVILVDGYRLTDGATPLVADAGRDLLVGAQHAMRAETPAGDVAVSFKLELAPKVLAGRLYNAINMRYPVADDNPDAKNSADAAHRIRRALEREYAENVRWAGGNLIFVLANLPIGATLYSAPHGVVQAATGRMSWVMCNDVSRLLDVLAVAENAVREMYVPAPAHDSVPFPPRLRIHVHPYTPEHDHRELWFDTFDWGLFEEEVRGMAPHAQTVGFFSTEVNSECPQCANAFRKLSELYNDKFRRATVVLNSNVVPNTSWAGLEASTGHDVDRTNSNSVEFNLFVLDTARVSDRSDPIRRMETMQPSFAPGMGIATLSSSRKGSIIRLRRHLVALIAHGAYGVKNPFTYMTNDGIDDLLSDSSSSQVLHDVIGRNLVSSMIARQASAATDVLRFLDALPKSGLDPAKVLDTSAYADLTQRLNLLLYKLEVARHSLSSENDVRAALHYALAARHDVRGMHNALQLGPLGLQDPAARCHFSIIKGGALRAGQMLMSGSIRVGIGSDMGGRGGVWTSWLVVLVAYCCGLAAARIGARYRQDRKDQGKLL